MDELKSAGSEGREGFLFGDPAVELSSNRTSMSFERTKMSADRTLMSIIRTSLSLIGFGFTLYQVLVKLIGVRGVTAASAANFSLALVLLGVGLLTAGLTAHVLAMVALRRRRGRLHGLGLLRSGPTYQTTPTAVIAILLLLVGVAAAFGMVVRVGPFG